MNKFLMKHCGNPKKVRPQYFCQSWPRIAVAQYLGGLRGRFGRHALGGARTLFGVRLPIQGQLQLGTQCFDLIAGLLHEWCRLFSRLLLRLLLL